MYRPQGIRVAVDLARMPSLFHSSYSMALPDDISDVISIAAGDEEACRRAALATGERTSVLVESARLYLKQVLFRPEADCFRVLGVVPGTSKSVARDHMRLLLMWLHPDHNRDGDSIFTNRVVRAWAEFSKGPEKPLRKSEHRALSRGPRRLRVAARLPLIQTPTQVSSARRMRLWTLIAIALAGVCVAVVAANFSDEVGPIAAALRPNP